MGIDNDSRGLRPGNPAHGQLRIIRKSGPDANNDDIHQGPQPVQVHQSLRSVDVFRVSVFSCQPAVERLAGLADDHEIVHRAFT